ncbi:MAG: aldehyde dehydrogenase [Halobacteriovoraceae bacterium]|nr:aldehyde dehydrogenase [Halobacteriovoraceae bacterium]
MKIINPYTQEVISEVTTDSKETIEGKFNKARTAQTAWSATSIDERLECIKKFSELMDQNKEALAKILTSEMGKPLQESINEINGARGRIQFFIENTKEAIKDKEVHDDGSTKEILRYEPIGTIGCISAWNYPYNVGVNVFIPGLLCGNSVLYKPSEFATLTGIEIQKMFISAGVPEDVFPIVIGEGDVGAMITDLPIDGMFFTGSYATGHKIYNKLAPRMIPVGLELGGKDPLYITDAITNIKKVASSAFEGAFYNNGQSCCAVERIYVHENVYPEFIAAISLEKNNVQPGNPMESTSTHGPIARKVHRSFLETQLKDAVDKGAKILFQKPVPHEGFFEPTVLTDVTHDMSLMKEETFGPLVGIQKVSSDEEALELMNDTDYGLASGVFCDDEERGEKILSKINAGSGYLNCSDRVSPHLPWAGRKHSGFGLTLSIHGIHTFCQTKSVHLRR